MEKYSNNNGPLHTILSVLNIGLEVILALIALGFIIGLYEAIS